MSATVTIIKHAIGVEITGVTGAHLVDRHAATDCQALLNEHGVVVDQQVDISDEDLVSRTAEHELPEIAPITLDCAKTDPALAVYRRGNFLWHIDGATDAVSTRRRRRRGGLCEIVSPPGCIRSCGPAATAGSPRLSLRHQWRRSDLVIWDNTGMLHRALPFEATSRQLMHRTTFVGEEGVA